MANEKKDPGGVGLQIECPTPVPDKSNLITNPNLPKPLTLEEKKYLLAVERGDLATVRRILQRAHRKNNIDINCVDSLGRGALTLAIDNETLEMVELLVIMNVQTKDALLQAINAEFVEAVELLLEHEELIHKDGELYSWQKTDITTAMFSPDITPLILAAHKNNYEIIKILLDRGATLPMPHDIRCGCEDCIKKTTEDSLRYSLSRVNEYRALASPSLIALSSNDPLLTAFELSWELRNLAFSEQESKAEYLELRRQCQRFAVDLLDQSRSSKELAIILNYDPESPPYQDGDHMKLARLELAIDYKQKKFVAHPNIQQLLAAIWYEGVPGFRRKTGLEKLAVIVKVAVLFPVYCALYMIAPNCATGKFIRKPFVKFLIHASSYLFFLFILILVSQRAEVQLVLLLGTESMKHAMQQKLLRQRGNGPTPLECLVVLYVLGFVWQEMQEAYIQGLKNYLRNMWNFIDFTRNTLYSFVFILRVVAYIQQSSEISQDPQRAFIAREQWDDFDPQLVADGLFAGANIFSALKLIHLFSINPHLGPLQISLGRMVIDIVKFFFIYSLVLFAFACGLNQLLWYYADLERTKCYVLPGGLADWDNAGDSCMKWRRFANLFESSQSLFWASFGMVGLDDFELTGAKSYTRFWGLLMFGSYSVINVIVLLNLLIAMMSNSYAMIVEHADIEWKFARTKLWMSYFEESATLPPPFNIFPTVKLLFRLFGQKTRKNLLKESLKRRKEEHRYTNVMRSLVWRYVCATHRKMEENPVTEDDVNEVKTEISAMRFEMLEVFERNGMDVSFTDKREKSVAGKKMKVWERQLMKDFHIAPVVNDGEAQEEIDPPPSGEKPLDRFRRVARTVASQTVTGRWSDVMRGVGIPINSQIGRCHNRDALRNQQNLMKAMNEARRLVEKGPLPRSRSVSPVEYEDHSKTLLDLLKSITDELDELSPQNTLNVTQARRSRSTTPNTAQLTSQLQAMIDKNPKNPGLKTPAGNDDKRRTPEPRLTSPPPSIEISKPKPDPNMKSPMRKQTSKDSDKTRPAPGIPLQLVKISTTPATPELSQKSHAPAPPVPKITSAVSSSSTEKLVSAIDDNPAGTSPPGYRATDHKVEQLQQAPRRQQPKTGWL